MVGTRSGARTSGANAANGEANASPAKPKPSKKSKSKAGVKASEEVAEPPPAQKPTPSKSKRSKREVEEAEEQHEEEPAAPVARAPPPAPPPAQPPAQPAEDDDDEAPEAVSMSTGKDQALQQRREEAASASRAATEARERRKQMTVKKSQAVAEKELLPDAILQHVAKLEAERGKRREAEAGGASDAEAAQAPAKKKAKKLVDPVKAREVANFKLVVLGRPGEDRDDIAKKARRYEERRLFRGAKRPSEGYGKPLQPPPLGLKQDKQQKKKKAGRWQKPRRVAAGVAAARQRGTRGLGPALGFARSS